MDWVAAHDVAMLLDDDPRFRRRMAETVLSDPARKAKVIRQLADSLS